MTENTPFDFVWLGLLIGVYDLVDLESGTRQLLNQLEDMGLDATKTRLQLEEDIRKTKEELRMFGMPVTDTKSPDDPNRTLGNFESDDIANWVAAELSEKKINSPHANGLDIHNSTNLINSLRPGVWSFIPHFAQEDFIEAEKSIQRGSFQGAALLLGGCVESVFNHFYAQILPTADQSISWSDKESALFLLRDRDLSPALYSVKDLRINHRNLAVHERKRYDKFEVVELWHMSVKCVSSMARILERRFSLPGISDSHDSSA